MRSMMRISISLVCLFCRFTKAEVEDAEKISHQTVTGMDDRALRRGDPTPEIDPDTPTNFGMRFCPWCERVHIVAAKKKLPLHIINLDLKNKPEWYILKHPEGKVPALEYKKKIVLDSAIIPEFLDDTFPEERILPSDPFEKSQQKMIASKLESIVPKAFYSAIDILKDPSVAASKQKLIGEQMSQAERILREKGLFFAGKHAGFADYLTIPFIERLFVISHKENVTGLPVENFPGVERFPELTKWYHKMSRLPEFEAVMQPIDVQLKFFEGYATGNPNFDEGLE